MGFTRLIEKGTQMLKRILGSKDLRGEILITERIN
ncbi:hypothetical protein SacN8_02560 [Sulfolobus acidocaldarius N8]|uniref:Uncharacterized protein n=2 Tax=Sulfolobus acidocaldarius TaxID=2285 RepID=M1IAC9_9CREN|nr:hypothetical protein SacN8_02560 [Sulfolobus acidocaldarius N8]AGE72763.1 hypothetical protein SacRon12I_02550 [Sulfolobus acidocaldarius Ron12/I]